MLDFLLQKNEYLLSNHTTTSHLTISLSVHIHLFLRDVHQNNLADYLIPVPEVKVQQEIANIYNSYTLRKEINEQMKRQIKDLCPILIKGSVEEASA